MTTTLRALLLAAVGAVVLTASGAAQEQAPADIPAVIAEAEAAYTAKDYATAQRLYRIAAEQGDARAQNVLGYLYDSGRGVPQDYTEAVKWYRLAADQGFPKAFGNLAAAYGNGTGVAKDEGEALKWARLGAEQGDAASQNVLGVLYASGQGVPKNDREAVKWYRLAADQGFASAQVNMGGMLVYGRGVPHNYAEAMKWYRRAAEQDEADAQYSLGLMYSNGYGVPKNDAEALRWYRLAADQGNAGAQSIVGFMYLTGKGAPENFFEAYKWLSLAAAQGHEYAQKNRDMARGQMTSAQIAEAQRLAAEWRPSGTEPAPRQSVGPETAEPKEGSGTGFYISASGHLVTNAHVVEGCRSIALANGTRLTLVDVDTSSDLALVKLADGASTVPLALRQGRGVRLAENVLAAGFPLVGILSSGLNVTTGAVSALAGIGDDRRRIQMTAPVQPGNSGGPLLDQSGNVVGVVVSKLALSVAAITGDIPQNVNFAVSLGTLQAFLDANNIDYQTRASSSPKSNADVAEMARAATVQIECRN